MFYLLLCFLQLLLHAVTRAYLQNLKTHRMILKTLRLDTCQTRRPATMKTTSRIWVANVAGREQLSKPSSWRHWKLLSPPPPNLPDTYESSWRRKQASVCEWFRQVCLKREYIQKSLGSTEFILRLRPRVIKLGFIVGTMSNMSNMFNMFNMAAYY